MHEDLTFNLILSYIRFYFLMRPILDLSSRSSLGSCIIIVNFTLHNWQPPTRFMQWDIFETLFGMKINIKVQCNKHLWFIKDYIAQRRTLARILTFYKSLKNSLILILAIWLTGSKLADLALCDQSKGLWQNT